MKAENYERSAKTKNMTAEKLYERSAGTEKS